MKAQNIKSFYGNETDYYLMLLSKSMAVHCTGNPNFIFLLTVLTDFVTAQGHWFDAVVAASTNDPELVAVAHEKRLLMEPLMTAVAHVVNDQAHHVKSKLISSGGELTSVGGTIGIFAKPIIEKIIGGPVKGSLSCYLHHAADDGKALGTMVYLTIVKTGETKSWFTTVQHIIVISSLTPGDEYSISFAWVGTDSTLNPSEPISKFAA